jgi:hypothetical protein
MEACVGAVTIRNAGEFNGFLKTKRRLFGEPLRFAAGALILSPGFSPEIDLDALAASEITREISPAIGRHQWSKRARRIDERGILPSARPTSDNKRLISSRVLRREPFSLAQRGRAHGWRVRPRCGRGAPPSRASRSHDVWPLLHDDERLGHDVLMPFCDVRLLFSTFSLPFLL